MTATEPMTPPPVGERPAPGLGRGGRMSRRRKLGAVLRLLRGEDLELVSRELGVTAARLAGRLPGRRRGRPERPRRARRPRPADRAPAGQGRRTGPRQRAARNQDRAPGGRPPFGPAEAEAMSRRPSPATGEVYGLAAVARAWRIARATVYRHRRAPGEARRRGAGPVRPGVIPTTSWWRRPGGCWPEAHSTARASARSGRGCASRAFGRRSGACCA